MCLDQCINLKLKPSKFKSEKQRDLAMETVFRTN